MGIGISVFLIAVGAILAFAVNIVVSGVDLDIVGMILMIAGGIGLLWSLLVLGRGLGGGTAVADVNVDEPVVTTRRTRRF